jgi:hypothetical protein
MKNSNCSERGRGYSFSRKKKSMLRASTIFPVIEKRIFMIYIGRVAINQTELVVSSENNSSTMISYHRQNSKERKQCMDK